MKEEELFYFDEEDIENISNELGFSSNEEGLATIESELYPLWKDQTKETNISELEEECKKDNKLSLKKFLFCEEYLKTGNIMKTCRNLGIGKTSAFNYLKEKEVSEYLSKRREAIQQDTEQMIQQNFQKAMEGLSELMEDSTFRSDEMRIKAIDTFLKHYNKTMKEEER